MFPRLLKGSAAGILAHQTNPLIEEWEERIPPAWTRLARYVVGMLVALPVGRSIFHLLYQPGMTKSEATDIYDAAFISAAVSLGVGVSLGYVLDRFIQIVRQE